MDNETLIAVTASLLKLDHKLHGTDPYVPQLCLMDDIVRFASDLDDLWDSLPEVIQDGNSRIWCHEIVPQLVFEYWEPDGKWRQEKMLASMVQIITEEWRPDELRQFAVQVALNEIERKGGI